jgi:uncharacterized protein
MAHVEQTARVDSISVSWVLPDNRPEPAGLALWLPALGRSKQDAIPFLHELADAGYVGISFDPWQHGDRGSESGEQIISRVFGNFRRFMWPILGNTTLDALRVLDWAISELAVAPRVVAGGVSMGGDVAVALAGIDRRVSRIAAVVATPDWTRPEMHNVDAQDELLPQGDLDAYARWFYAHLDPMTHLPSYAHGPAITFECGGNDTHVPPDDALRFQTALGAAYPANRDRVQVRVHAGVGHLDGARGNATMLRKCLTWLTTDSTER